MDDFPRQKLCELINRYGTILCEEVERCESLLNQVCAKQYHREIFVLINAVKEGFVEKLLTQTYDDTLIEELSEALHYELCLEKEAATWAIQSWAIALNTAEKTDASTKQKTSDALVVEKIEPSALRQLSYLNPLDYFRLLWWVLVSPKKIIIYRRVFGQEDEQRIGNWLVSSLIWYPLLIPNLALGLKQLPYSDRAWLPEIYLLLTFLLIACWLLTSKLKVDKSISISLAMLVSVVMAALVAVSFTGIIINLLPFLMTLNSIILILVVITGMIIITNTVLLSILMAGDVIIAIAGVVAIGIAVGVAGSVAILTANFIFGFGIALFAGFIASFGVDFITNKMKNIIGISLNTGIPSFLGRMIFLLLILNYGFLIGLLVTLHYFEPII